LEIRAGEVVMAGQAPKLDPFAVARAAGLEELVNTFPDDVVASAQAMANDLVELPENEVAAEPWPPMQIRPMPTGSAK
jgi:hypothetical protein